jgi:hypothetical protein
MTSHAKILSVNKALVASAWPAMGFLEVRRIWDNAKKYDAIDELLKSGLFISRVQWQV